MRPQVGGALGLWDLSDAERAAFQSQLESMAASHRHELAAKERAAAAALEREALYRERSLAELEASFNEERAEMQHRQRTAARGSTAGTFDSPPPKTTSPRATE